MVEKDSTESLVARARDGDRGAFDDLVALYRDRLQQIVRSRCGPQVRANLESEDLVQETFVRAYQAIGQLKWQGDKAFLRWLVRIAEHLIWNAAQKRPRVSLATTDHLEDTGTSPEQLVRRHERFDRLEDALTALSSDQREAVQLSRLEGLKISEIARRMNRSTAAVKMLLSRALKQLKSSFGDTESLNLPDRQLEMGDDDGGE